MKKLVELLTTLFPLILGYPIWAQLLFAVTFILTLTSLAVFVLLYSQASSSVRRRERAAKIRIVQFVIDSAKSVYEMHVFDPNKPLFPATDVEHTVHPDGRETIAAYGRVFVSEMEYEAFEQALKRRSNYELFSEYADMHLRPADIPLIFVTSDDRQSTDPNNSIHNFCSR